MTSKPSDHISNVEHHKLCILIVEDSTFLRDVFRKALRAHYSIYTAGGAKEGWRLYADKKPDIVFIDIGLPDGSGHDLTVQIKKDNPACYIVMATASTTFEEKEMAAHNHADGFITKPFNMREIDDCIERYLSIRSRDEA
ncbi:MAG: response regulator [Alphaproteobacteria bacterium]|nr:response regulator [Alphaproteobacteria bacterium]